MRLLNATLPIESVKLHTTTESPPAGKEYLYFQINGKPSHATQCVKSRIINKSIDYILLIYKFEQKYIVIKGLLQLQLLEDHMKTIGIEQSLSNRPSVDFFLNNIKKIYQHAGKCYDQQNLKDIIGAAMVSTPKEVTDVSPSLCITQTTV